MVIRRATSWSRRPRASTTSAPSAWIDAPSRATCLIRLPTTSTSPGAASLSPEPVTLAAFRPPNSPANPPRRLSPAAERLDKAEAIAEKLRQQVEEFRFPHGGTLFRIGASIGVVPILDAETPLTDLMKAVDSACYVAKEKGRNGLVVYERHDAEVAQRRDEMDWMARINHYLEGGQVRLYAQPIRPLSPMALRGLQFEVLLRMVEPADGSRGGRCRRRNCRRPTRGTSR